MSVTDELLGILPPVVAAGAVSGIASNMMGNINNMGVDQEANTVVYWIVTSHNKQSSFSGPFSSLEGALKVKTVGKAVIYPSTERNAAKAKIEYNQMHAME